MNLTSFTNHTSIHKSKSSQNMNRAHICSKNNEIPACFSYKYELNIVTKDGRTLHFLFALKNKISKNITNNYQNNSNSNCNTSSNCSYEEHQRFTNFFNLLKNQTFPNKIKKIFAFLHPPKIRNNSRTDTDINQFTHNIKLDNITLDTPDDNRKQRRPRSKVVFKHPKEPKSRQSSPPPKLKIGSLSNLFYDNSNWASNQYFDDGWLIYDIFKEFCRQKLEYFSTPKNKNLGTAKFRISSINKEYKFCGSYPAYIIIPANITDKHLSAVAKFRSKARIPAVTYYHSKSDAVIMRCSQPLTGMGGLGGLVSTSWWSQNRCENDELLVWDAHIRYIVDARPRINAVVNQAAGGGYENSQFYKKLKKFLFADIHNIHKVRQSYELLNRAIFNNNLKYEISLHMPYVRYLNIEKYLVLKKNNTCEKQIPIKSHSYSSPNIAKLPAVMVNKQTVSSVVINGSVRVRSKHENNSLVAASKAVLNTSVNGSFNAGLPAVIAENVQQSGILVFFNFSSIFFSNY